MTDIELRKMTSSGHYPAVTPDDDADLSLGSDYPVGISCTGAGTIRVTDLQGDVQNFASGEIPANGSPFPIAFSKVHATGTTATGIRVYYP